MTFSRRDTLKLGGALSLAGLAAGASRASQTVDPKASQAPGKPNVDYRR